MFKRILLPTDGSELALRAVDTGIALAARLSAGVYAFHAMEPYTAYTTTPEYLILPEDYNREVTAMAERFLEEVKDRAAKAGVAYDGGFEFADQPYRAIVAAAVEQHCDLIVMGSHGRRGFDRLLLGSQTYKVIQHGDIPVLVCR